MYENVVYISSLKPDFDYLDLEDAIQLDGDPDEIMQDYVIHNNNAIFLSLADTRFVDKVISQYDGKQLLGSVLHVSRLTQELVKVKPLCHKVATVGFGEVNPMPLFNPVPPSGGFILPLEQNHLLDLEIYLRHSTACQWNNNYN